tara:strand:+ start:62 stop:208 length:147 start_codon:yes stop_codon:yes gene_type:complete
MTLVFFWKRKEKKKVPGARTFNNAVKTRSSDISEFNSESDITSVNDNS